MSTNQNSRFTPVAPAHSGPPYPAAQTLSLSAALGDQLSRLYSLVQHSAHVFGSPLGPLTHEGRNYQLPRFVYFGPHTSEESVRLAFLGSFDSRDLRPTLALLHLVEGLALEPSIGQSLHLAFYPLIDLLGHLRAVPDRSLRSVAWTYRAPPEITLLAQDAKHRAYHGFVRIETAPADEAITLRLRGPHLNPDESEFISSEETDPYPVRFESWPDEPVREGPLSLGDDLLFQPFEVTLRVPANWPIENYSEAVSSILKRFIVRYRGLLAYGQHL
jgi:hypothetical protein